MVDADEGFVGEVVAVMDYNYNYVDDDMWIM